MTAQTSLPLAEATQTPGSGREQGKLNPGPGLTPRVIGLDLSIAATGVADNYDGTIHTATVITKPARGPEPAATRDRLRRIITEIDGVLRANPRPPVLVAVEGPSFGSKGNALHQIAGLWWLVMDALIAAGHPVVVVPPSTLKAYATGRGNADKPDMRVALLQRTGIDQRDNNQVDAHFLVLAALDHLGYPLVDIPKNQRAALDKVTWPEVTTHA